MTSLQHFETFLILLSSDLRQFYASNLNLSISQTIDLIDDLWLLGTFTDFSPDQIEFFSFCLCILLYG
jgi:hypothetical protein